MEEIAAAPGQLIELNDDRWRLFQVNSFERLPVLEAQRKGAVLFYRQDFGRKHGLPPGNWITGEQVAQVVVGWAPDQRCWLLGLQLRGAEGDRWCELVRFPPAPRDQHSTSAQRAARALAEALSAPLRVIRDPVVTTPVPPPTPNADAPPPVSPSALLRPASPAAAHAAGADRLRSANCPGSEGAPADARRPAAGVRRQVGAKPVPSGCLQPPAGCALRLHRDALAGDALRPGARAVAALRRPAGDGHARGHERLSGDPPDARGRCRFRPHAGRDLLRADAGSLGALLAAAGARANAAARGQGDGRAQHRGRRRAGDWLVFAQTAGDAMVFAENAEKPPEGGGSPQAVQAAAAIANLLHVPLRIMEESGQG
ncbi:MAG: hypothetical protein M5R40_26690 [Anaerolineae bacterium]|nr:hypothetical protein [Anaerolineae bacterium]